MTIEHPNCTLPEPFCVKMSPEEMVLPAVVVSVPLLLIEMGPEPVVVTFCRKVNAEPVKWIPPLPLVEMLPLNKEVPVREEADCVKEEAVTACVVKLPTVEMVKLPREWILPTAPAIVISFVPEERVRLPDKFPGPSIVLANVIFRLAALVSIDPIPETTTGSSNWTAPPAVIELERRVLPVPISVKAPDIFPVAAEI